MAAVLVSVAARGESPPDLPVAPLPEGWSADRSDELASAVRVDDAVRPAAVTTVGHPQAAGSLGPVPLTDSRGSAGSAGPPQRPLTDWSVLAAILGAFAILAVFRLRTGRRDRGLPAEVFDVLGHGSLGGQHAVRVVRFGPRTLLIGISAAGSQTLAEIDDPAVTERITAACLARAVARGPVPAAALAAGGKSRPTPSQTAAGEGEAA